jgi:hypothetical protein
LLGLARVADETHPTAQLILAFLEDSDWRNTVVLTSGSLVLDRGTRLPMQISAAGLAYAERIPAGPVRIVVDDIEESMTVPPGDSRAIVLKNDPRITSSEPAAGAIWPLVNTAITSPELRARCW